MAASLASFHSHDAPRIPIEGRGNQRWSFLEQRLEELNSHRGLATIRILQLGDSHTAGVFLPERMASLMHQRFGNAGIGLLPPGRLDQHPPVGAKVSQTPRWAVRQARRQDRASTGLGESSPTGLGGFVGNGSEPYQMVTYEFPKRSGLARLIVYADVPDRGGRPFRLYDGDRELLPAEPRDDLSWRGRSVFPLRGTEERLTLISRTDARQFSLLGVSALSYQPGIIFSRIGQNGATLAVLKEWDNEVTRAQLLDYAPHLVILVFGTNDAVGAGFSESRLRNDLVRASEWIARHAPSAAVLVVMPPHAPLHGEATNLNLRRARTAMRQMADEQGWRTWDWSALTMAHCLSLCRTDSGEPLFQPDGIHLTRKGYEATADAIVEAITALASSSRP